MKIRAIIKRPDERYGHVTNISDTPGNLEKIIDGRIKVEHIASDTVLLSNEDAVIFDLPKNITIFTYPFMEVVRGTVIVLGHDGMDYYDCPIDFKAWKRILREWGNE